MKQYIVTAIKSSTNYTATGACKVGINSINTYADALSKFVFDEKLDLNNTNTVRDAIMGTTKYGPGTKRKLISALRNFSKDPKLKHDICALNLLAKEKYAEQGYVQKHQELIHPEDIVKYHRAAYDKCKPIIDSFSADSSKEQRKLRPREKRYLQEFILLWLVYMNVPRRSKLYLYLHHGPCPNLFEREHNYLDMDEMKLYCNNYKTYAWYNQQILKLNDPQNNIYNLPIDKTNEVLEFYKEHIYRHEISQSVFKLKESANNSSMVAKLQRITQKNISFQTSRKSFATFYIEESNHLTQIAYEMAHHLKTHVENYILHSQAAERGLQVPKHVEEDMEPSEGSDSSESEDMPDFLKKPAASAPEQEESDSSESELWTTEEIKNSNNIEAEAKEAKEAKRRYPRRRKGPRVSYKL
ncbi:hypothetical protein KIPB_004504 [Kipferlia bialata]|uniref:Uncharacterized protein n=1 Tax=Kipferlia bialata TaxID=797122 RepID=A0A391P219_9EUKA|nr:hypothetical protein KIPB_004504 [Kipferlia bialata]|eukprot:g4504.t1